VRAVRVRSPASSGVFYFLAILWFYKCKKAQNKNKKIQYMKKSEKNFYYAMGTKEKFYISSKIA